MVRWYFVRVVSVSVRIIMRPAPVLIWVWSMCRGRAVVRVSIFMRSRRVVPGCHVMWRRVSVIILSSRWGPLLR